MRYFILITYLSIALFACDFSPKELPSEDRKESFFNTEMAKLAKEHIVLGDFSDSIGGGVLKRMLLHFIE